MRTHTHTHTHLWGYGGGISFFVWGWSACALVALLRAGATEMAAVGASECASALDGLEFVWAIRVRLGKCVEGNPRFCVGYVVCVCASWIRFAEGARWLMG